MDKVVTALGKKDEKNGVVLTSMSIPGKYSLAQHGSDGSIGVDVGKIAKLSASMVAPSNPGVSGESVRDGIGGGAVAHEVRHELDRRSLGTPTSRADHLRRELNAYGTESGVHQGLGLRTALSSPDMTDAQRAAAIMRGAQASVDAECASGGC